MAKLAQAATGGRQIRPWLALVLTAALTLSACEEIKGGLESANQSLQEALGEDDDGSAKPDSEAEEEEKAPSAEALFQVGMAQMSAGQTAEALANFELAAEMGHRAAAYEAAQAYRVGLGTEVDPARAAEWMTVAADLGESRAIYLAGLNYATGNGVARDDTRAAGYFHSLATQGHGDAQYHLAEAYTEGHGVPKDVGWAMRWYAQAAQRGHAKAQLALGVLYAAGTAYPKDLETGFRWLLVSAAQGNSDAARAVHSLQDQLGPKQRKNAKAWAKAFKAGAPSAFADKPTIMYAQDRLNRMGLQAGPVDGITGLRTDRAVRRYRAAKGLTGGTSITADLVETLFRDAHRGY